jgi:TctA family transporter
MLDFSALVEGLSGVLAPKPLMLMVFGMAVSSVFAAIPGIGSLLFLSMMIPYSMTLTPYECIALLLGIATVSNTANTFSSVLLAVPGSAGSQATIVDGFPMAQKGEANRAFGAAFAASACGALFGALVFVIALPVMQPLVLSVGSPELMMLVLWGLCSVALLGGSNPIKGLLAAVMGLGISLIGADMRSGVERFTFEGLYLVRGVNVIIIALGIFAVPELIALAARGTTIARAGDLGTGLMQGVRDVFKNWWLVIRCATIGVWVGAMPGLGSSVADWFAYAHTVQSCRDKENFGKGDVRGVIGPESSNNAKEGGALIPTTLFGIPGSTSFALILYAFIAVGIQPGQSIITRQLPYLYAMIGVLVIANLLATALAMSCARSFAKVTLVSPIIIFPLTLALCFIGAFSVNYEINDLVALIVFSAIGFFMKRFQWPRPPVLLAVVLGPQFETYLWLTTDRYGMAWISQTGVLVVFALILVTVFLPVANRAFRRGGRARMVEVLRPREGDIVMLFAVVGILAYGAYVALDWPTTASAGVFTVAGVGTVLAVAQLTLSMLRFLRTDDETARDGEVTGSELGVIAWILGFLAAAALIGVHTAFLLFPIAYIRANGGSWQAAIACGAVALGTLLTLFEFLIQVVWPEPLLWTMFQ